MKVLIVEDEEKLALAIQKAFQIEGYVAEVVFDGAEAISFAEMTEYDVILLDSMLPSYSGPEVCKILRSQSITTPIIMLTAKGQVSDKVAALDYGADDYMVKPFSFDELFSRVRAVLRRANKTEDFLQVGDLRLDPASKKVFQAEKELEFSAKEYAILEYLLHNKNSVVSKEKIIDHVWDYTADVLPTTVEVHIKHIRDKLHDTAPYSIIETVRGFGYQIQERK